MTESVEFTPEEKSAPEGHEEKMAKHYESQSEETESSEGQTQDSSTDESKKDSGESQETQEDSDTSDKTEDKEESDSDDDSEQKTPSTEDFDRYSQEFAEKGELSDESYQELQEKYNLPKEVVDRYISNQNAAVQAIETAGYEVAGGKDQYQQMAQWAKQNLPEGEIQEFNQKVSSGNVQEAVQAVTQMKQKYQDAVGDEPNLIEGDGTADTSTGYKSRAEMTKDMTDPRYKKDPAFRAEVERKLRNSNIL